MRYAALHLRSRHTTPRFGSLFCGCGGFDLGFLSAGFECTLAADIDPLAVRVYRHNLRGRAHVCDLSVDRAFPDALRGVDVLLAGSPCQGFSTAGKRELDDPRNGLLLDAARIAVAARPRVFVAENVVGVTCGAHRTYWETVHVLLRDAGYSTADMICSAQHCGVPQVRRRMVMIAWHGALPVRLVAPDQPGGVLGDALRGVDGAPNHCPVVFAADSDADRIARRIMQGQKLSNVRAGPTAVHTWDIPDVFGPVSRRERAVLEGLLVLRRRHRVRAFGDADPVGLDVLCAWVGFDASPVLARLRAKGYVREIGDLYDLMHTYNGKYRRLRSDAPSLTVDTRFGDPRLFLHPCENRGFTVREAARIQGFPDSFVFMGKAKAQYRMVGNAVPPPMGAALASLVRSSVLGAC